MITFNLKMYSIKNQYVVLLKTALYNNTLSFLEKEIITEKTLIEISRISWKLIVKKKKAEIFIDVQQKVIF